MASNRLSEIIIKIKKTDDINDIDTIKHINKLENGYNINNISEDEKTEKSKNVSSKYIDIDDIKEIIREYKSYPLYLIKYIFTLYPKNSSREALDYIVKSVERRSDLMECILTSFTVKLCEIPDISFDCNIIRMKYDILELERTINSDTQDNERCNCMDRKHWTYLYNFFMELINKDDRFMFDSYNVNYSITNLVSQTDVADNKLADILKKSINIPERWRSLLLFIKNTGLVSYAYGDMIFSIRDAIIMNDREDEKNKDIKIIKFKDRVLLSVLLKRYNEYHRNMSMITDNMYITDINGASNTDLLKDKNIDYVVSLTKQSFFKASNVKYIQIQIDDIESADFLVLTLDYADKVIELILQDKIILVHCYKGVSRSV